MKQPDQHAMNSNAQDLGMQWAQVILTTPPSDEDGALFYNEEAMVFFLAGASFYLGTHVANEKYQMRHEGPLEGPALEAFHATAVKVFLGRVAKMLSQGQIITSVLDGDLKVPKK